MSVVVLVDTMLYAVLAPLLPGLAHSLHLTKLSAGLLTASYPIGMLVGSIPGGLLVVRIGPRATVAAGLSLLTASTVAFGWLDSAGALDAARLIEGLGGACSWAGGIAWLTLAAPPEQRGAMIGKAVGAAIGGALLGPVLGTGASAIGRPALFSALAVGVGGLAVWAARQSRPDTTDQGAPGVLVQLRRPDIVAGMWLVGLPAVASGAINVLGPLRLHHFGAGALVIGAAFLTAAAIEAVIAPVVGSVSDRLGRLAPLRLGLATTTIALLCFTLPGSDAVLGLLIVAISAALGLFWAPAMAMLADAAQANGLHQGMAAALMNLAWAGGQILGSGAGGALAKSAGDGLPIALAAALCALTLGALMISPRRIPAAGRG